MHTKAREKGFSLLVKKMYYACITYKLKMSLLCYDILITPLKSFRPVFLLSLLCSSLPQNYKMEKFQAINLKKRHPAEI